MSISNLLNVNPDDLYCSTLYCNNIDTPEPFPLIIGAQYADAIGIGDVDTPVYINGQLYSPGGQTGPAGSLSAWSLLGNTGTSSGTNFIGTIDNQPLLFKTNNTNNIRFTTKGAIETLGNNQNVFVGELAGEDSTLSVLQSVGIGYSALANVTTGTYSNTGVGYNALATTTQTRNSTAIGNSSQRYGDNASSFDNTSCGSGSLYLGGGSRNNCFGTSAGAGLNIGAANENCGFGSETLAHVSASTALRCNAYGNRAMHIVSSASDSCAFGTASQYFSTTAQGNCSFGNDTLANLVNGNNNTVMGFGAGQGYYGNESDNILFGHTGITGDNGIIRIGNTGQHLKNFQAGIRGVTGDTGGVPVYITSTGQLCTNGGGASYTVAAPINGVDANGIIINNTLNTVTLEVANGSQPGIISTGYQSIAGVKNFTSAPNFASMIIPGVIHNTVATGALTSSLIVNSDVHATAGIVDSKLATIATALKVSNSATTAASANTASAIVARDGSGNFTAGTITATVTGSASLNVLKSGDSMSGALTMYSPSFPGTPAIRISGSTGTGISSQALNTIMFSTNSTERMTIGPTGQVNITNCNANGVIHSNSGGGYLTTSAIVDADIQNSTITNSKLATVSSANTNSYIMARDGSGNVACTTLTGNVIGNLSGSVTGNVTGSASLNVAKSGDTMTNSLIVTSGTVTVPSGFPVTPGLTFVGSTGGSGFSANIANVITCSTNGAERWTVGSTGLMNIISLNSGGLVKATTGIGLLSASALVDADITNGTISNAKLATVSSANTNSYIMARDGSGNVACTTLTGNVNGVLTTLSYGSMCTAGGTTAVALNTWTKLTNMTSSNTFVNFTRPADNQLTYTGTTTQPFTVTCCASISSSVAASLYMAITKNGATPSGVFAAQGPVVSGIGIVTNFSPSGIFSLATNDYVSLWVFANAVTTITSTYITVSAMS